MGFKIIWSPTARSDLRDIVCYIARDNPRRAEQFGYELMAQAEKMENFPDLGRQVPEQHDPQIREIIYGRYRISTACGGNRVRLKSSQSGTERAGRRRCGDRRLDFPRRGNKNDSMFVVRLFKKGLVLFAILGAITARANDRLVVIISVDGLASYYLDDPKAHLPTIRKLAREGAVASRMKCAMPTVTWPNHTTLVTGVSPARHGVLGNSVWDRGGNKKLPLILDPVLDKSELLKVPTLYDLAHHAGLKTAGICWPATRNVKTLDWTVPDCGTDELFQKFGTPQLLDECRAESIPIEMQQTWSKAKDGGVARDWMYARMASLIIRRHQPNLLLIHLVKTDHAQHDHGPKSADAYWACSYEDDRVREVLEACEAACPGRFTLIVTSDHGFVPHTREILPNVWLRQQGLVKLEDKKPVANGAMELAQGGSSFIYVLDKARRAELLTRMTAVFRGAEGVDSVIEEKDFAALGMATPDKDPHAPDLVLTAKEGFTFGDDALGESVIAIPSDGEIGSHGHSNELPMMYATFVAYGTGIQAGAKLGEINNTDVAPTVARLLGLKMENVEGRVLDEVLKK